MVRVYAPTSSYESEAVDSSYGNVESEINKVKVNYSIAMGDFNAKMGKKKLCGQTCRGKLWNMYIRNSRGDVRDRWDKEYIIPQTKGHGKAPRGKGKMKSS